MRILVDSQEMKQCDAYTIEQLKVPSMVLMERAALAVVEEIESRRIDRSSCLVVCGLGNNGGDGLAIARLLHLKGSSVTVVCDMKAEKATEQARQQYDIVKQYGIEIVPEIPRGTFTLIIDAIFGIGLSREVQGHWRRDIEKLNQMEGYKLSVDIPSGICGDDGQILGAAFAADLTVTFAYEKTGLLLYPGYAYAGTVAVKDIGIDRYSWKNRQPSAFAFEASDLHMLPERRNYSNKGTYGRVLVIAGKSNMAGAAYFSGKAAAMTGCGLVKIMTAEENRVILQQLLPEAILETFCSEELITVPEEGQEHDKLFTKLKESISWADVIAAGPGLGTGAAAERIVTAVVSLTEKPLILDADALNILADKKELLQRCRGPVILTPHLGEMSRLTGKSIGELQKNIITVAGNFAKEYNVICVLKDARTVTALPDGTSYINTSGNHGMATAGAGDVLTGVIAGLTAQGMDAAKAAPFGVFLHGMSGDAMVEETGCYSMMATDIIEGIRKITRKE